MSKKKDHAQARRSGRSSGGDAQGGLLHTLERLCDQLQRVATTFERIRGLVERHLPPEIGPGEPRATSPAAPQREEPRWTFAKLIKAARSVVRGEPDREWAGPDICQGLVDAGARLDSWRGVPMKITAELKRQGVIQAVTRARFRVTRAAAALSESEQDTPASKTPPTPTGHPPKVRARESPTPAPTIPWDDIVAAARRILNDDRARVWTWSELAQTARASGVTSPTWKGVHIGLVAKLEVLGLVERVDAQRLRAISSVTPSSSHDGVAGETIAAMDSAASSEKPIEEGAPAAPDTTASEAPAPVTTASLPAVSDSVFALADEIKELGPWLGDLPQRQRTAQVAAWAGRVRRLQDGLGNLPPDVHRRERDEIRPMLGGLARLAKRHGCDWVDALSSEWEAEDWNVYVQFNHAVASGQAPTFAREQEELYHRDRVRGLFNPHQRTAQRDAPDVIREALAVLSEGDAVLARAIHEFGRPPERRVVPPDPRPPFRRREDAQARAEAPVAIVRDVPADVLAVTRGKRALIAGGQGSREAHRAAIERSLQLERLEWVFGERGKASHFSTLERRMRPGRYDLVFFLASHSGHKSGSFIQACRTAGIPLIYLARGYGVNQVVDAIRQQFLARHVPEWMEKR